jgi:hypothetical protein
MGTWGAGNFDSDTAADHLAELTARLVKEITAAMEGDAVELEADEYWGVAVPCNVELLALLAEQRWVGVVLPDATTAQTWKAKLIAAWDGSIDALGPSEAHRRDRHAVLVATFDRLIAAITRA